MKIDYSEQHKKLDKNSFLELNIPFVQWIINGFGDKLQSQLGMDNEDIMQEGFISLMYAYDKFDANKAKWSTYAAIVLRHDILIMLRKRRIRADVVNTLSLNELVSIGEDGVERGEVIGQEDTELEQYENEEFIKQALAKIEKKLTDKEKAILDILRKHDKIKQRDIGKLAGVTQAQVSRIMKKIIKKGEKIAQQIA